MADKNIKPYSVSGPLSAGQIASFHRDGFVVVPGLIGAELMNEVRRWTEEVQNWPETPGKHMMYFETADSPKAQRILNRVENFLPYHDGFNALAVGALMQGACGQLFGEPAVLFKDKINFKMPGGGGFESHQDVQAGWARYAKIHITALVTIDKSTRENGCLELVPGYHQQDLIGSEWKPLTEEDVPDDRFIVVEAEPGDAVFFDSYAPHRSGPNRSSAARRVLYITYNKLSEGDHLAQYYADKRANFPPDCERAPGTKYAFKV